MIRIIRTRTLTALQRAGARSDRQTVPLGRSVDDLQDRVLRAVDGLQVRILRTELALRLLREIDLDTLPPEAADRIRRAHDVLVRGGEADTP
ncbi:hypothetical protein OG711_38815 (plasmid) [Streptomyces uncialis]|uniref:hypothetical protein n=1 Tax=Streptomyces uncialis TaxID=1048205 RepID=UPI002E3819F6|nr:hypothetical protein [Streptomyces uncialis]WTE16047.1 hypothetical protein OG924_37555 [Streptomyces uncialis]